MKAYTNMCQSIVSKLDADLLEISPIPTQLTKIIRHALKIFDRELKRSDILLSIEEDESLRWYGIDWVSLISEILNVLRY
jgi:hypothetical protein